jgi:hypothetical protein
MIVYTIVVGCTGKSSVRKVNHPSTIPVLGGLTLMFPWDLVKALSLSHPLLKLAIMVSLVLGFDNLSPKS